MSGLLTPADLLRMRAEHVEVEHHVTPNGEEQADVVLVCVTCFQYSDDEVDATPWPCDAARLLAHFAPVRDLPLAGISAGLFGPSDTSELPQ